MIYFLHGTDIEKGRTKAHELIASLLKKKPGASCFKVDSQNWDEARLKEYAGGQGLFENKYIIFIDRVSEDKKIKDSFLSKVQEMAESSNIFIILEGKLDKVSLKKIEKKAEKTQEFALQDKSVKKEEYNAFALADALARRDRKSLWVLYRKAIDRGEAPEAIHGMLFWKVKTMMLSSPSAERHALAERLIDVYHEARRGKHELETGLETLLLQV